MEMLSRFTWLHLFHIFNKFSIATGLTMNLHKSIVYHDVGDFEVVEYIKNLFGIEAEQMLLGMQYLGYRIKPKCYRNTDWQSLVDRFSKWIAGWEFRCLSLGGM